MEDEYIRLYNKKHEDDENKLTDKSDILGTLNKSYLIVDAYVTGRSDKTLSADTQFQSVRGGGQFNLSDIVVLNKGSFYIHFKVSDPDQKLEDISKYDLYFWSHKPPEQIKGKRYGLDCGTLVKLDPKTFNSEPGFHLNATNSRYKPVINGTYYFVRYDLPRMAVAVIRIGDKPDNSGCLKD